MGNRVEKNIEHEMETNFVQMFILMFQQGPIHSDNVFGYVMR